MSSKTGWPQVDQPRNFVIPVLKDDLNKNMYQSSPCFQLDNSNNIPESEISELEFLLQEARLQSGDYQFRNKNSCPPSIITSSGCKYINLSLSNYEMAREVDLDNARIATSQDHELKDLLGSFDRDSESSFIRKLRGEEDFSSSLSNSYESQATYSHESSLLKDDPIFSRNETPGLAIDNSVTLETSESERINELVQKCNNSDTERYTLSFQDEFKLGQPKANPDEEGNCDQNFKNGNLMDDFHDLPVNLRRSSRNRCMNEQVLRDEIKTPTNRSSGTFGHFLDEERKKSLIRLFTNDSHSKSGESSYGSSEVSLETGAKGGQHARKSVPTSADLHRTFMEIERQRQQMAEALPIPELEPLAYHERFQPSNFNPASTSNYYKPSQDLSWKSPPRSVAASRHSSVEGDSFRSSERRAPHERPTSFKQKSRNVSPGTLYVCYPNYSLPDMTFVQKIIGPSSPGLVLSPTKPLIKSTNSEQKTRSRATRPKSFGGYERLSRQNFNHIKDWDSLNVLLPDDLKHILDGNNTSNQSMPSASVRLRRTASRGNRSHRFSLQEPPIPTIYDEDEEDSEVPKRDHLARSETITFGKRPSMATTPTAHHCGISTVSCCHSAAFVNHCAPIQHPVRCCTTQRDPLAESLTKESMEKLNKLLSMSDALEEITSLLNLVTNGKNNSSVQTPDGRDSSASKRSSIPRAFKSQIPVAAKGGRGKFAASAFK